MRELGGIGKSRVCMTGTDSLGHNAERAQEQTVYGPKGKP